GITGQPHAGRESQMRVRVPSGAGWPTGAGFAPGPTSAHWLHPRDSQVPARWRCGAPPLRLHSRYERLLRRKGSDTFVHDDPNQPARYGPSKSIAKRKPNEVGSPNQLKTK